jgi:hypothetical protein
MRSVECLLEDLSDYSDEFISDQLQWVDGWNAGVVAALSKIEEAGSCPHVCAECAAAKIQNDELWEDNA